MIFGRAICIYVIYFGEYQKRSGIGSIKQIWIGPDLIFNTLKSVVSG